jgi:hypothetical protein
LVGGLTEFFIELNLVLEALPVEAKLILDFFFEAAEESLAPKLLITFTPF